MLQFACPAVAMIDNYLDLSYVPRCFSLSDFTLDVYKTRSRIYSKRILWLLWYDFTDTFVMTYAFQHIERFMLMDVPSCYPSEELSIGSESVSASFSKARISSRRHGSKSSYRFHSCPPHILSSNNVGKDRHYDTPLPGCCNSSSRKLCQSLGNWRPSCPYGGI